MGCKRCPWAIRLIMELTYLIFAAAVPTFVSFISCAYQRHLPSLSRSELIDNSVAFCFQDGKPLTIYDSYSLVKFPRSEL
ncbi:hypothetical protein K445DRAFT_243721 [Daldinia sp. EC12]|nr:hypothetical protein K445DRAFT_243721 [Daldinia sp. EC12]